MHREICVKDFLETAAPRILKLGSNIGYDYLYCVREIQHSHVCRSLYLPIFSSPEQKLRMSYCHHPMSVVRRRPSFVVNN